MHEFQRERADSWRKRQFQIFFGLVMWYINGDITDHSFILWDFLFPFPIRLFRRGKFSNFFVFIILDQINLRSAPINNIYSVWNLKQQVVIRPVTSYWSYAPPVPSSTSYSLRGGQFYKFSRDPSGDTLLGRPVTTCSCYVPPATFPHNFPPRGTLLWI